MAPALQRGQSPVYWFRARAATVSRASAYLELTKPRLTLLVLVTTAAGAYLAASGAVDPWLVARTLLGTWLVASGASALNQVAERDADARMQRTQARPLPSGRLQALEALRFGVALSVAGLLLLAVSVNLLASLLAAATLGLYLFLYTPLKRRTALCTLIGAVPGAIPPMIGWAAVRGALGVEGWVLFAVLFLWQLPHFLAIAWLYREDYARAGFPMLPVIDPDGGSTARQAVLYAAALVPVSLMPTLLGLAGSLYFVGALLLGAAFLAVGSGMLSVRSNERASRLFLASIAYLPLLLTLMVCDKVLL